MADQNSTNLPLANEDQAPRRVLEDYALAPSEPIPRPLTLRTITDLFARQHVLIFVTMALALSIGVIAILATSPIYASVTEILVEGRTQTNPGQNPNDPINQVSLPNPETDIITQIQVLQSSKLLLDAFALANVTYSAADIENGLAPKVSVEQVGATSVLQVRVESASPRTAQDLARAIPEVYLGYVKTTRQAEAKSALQSLETRLAAERSELVKAEGALQDFKARRQLLPLANEANLRSQTLNSMEVETARSRAAVSAAEERLRALTAQLAAQPETLTESASEANSIQIEAQKGVIADLKARRQALLIEYLPTHPQVLALDAQIIAAEARLKEIPKQLDRTNQSRHPEVHVLEQQIATARAELKAAQAQSQRLDKTAMAARAALQEYYQLEPKQNELAQVVEDRRLAILNMSKALDDLRVRSSAAREPVTVLTPATAANKARPNEIQYLSVSILAGLFFAVILASAKDGFEQRVVNAEELAAESRLEILGEVVVNKPKKRPVRPDQLSETALESYRQVRHRILLACENHLNTSILVAGSGASNESVPEVVANLAIGFAAQQRKVLVVDTDLRHRNLTEWLGGEPQPGLSDVLQGKCALSSAIHSTHYEGLSMLPAGSHTPNSTDLLSATAASRLFAELQSDFDLLLLVGPGYSATADSEIVSNYVDSSILVAKLLRTTRSEFSNTLLPIRRSNVHQLGIVLTKEAPKRLLRR